jgi:hypothetical protein
MGGRFVLTRTRRRIEVRGIVDRYLVALEREERQRAAGVVGEPAGAARGLESASLQPSFVRVAAEFSRRHGITYATWLEAKVSAEVLEAAGLTSALDAAI